MNEVAVIDYGLGNVKSIENALLKVGCKPILTNKEEVILNADKCVLPGVGAFAVGMEKLLERGLDSVILKYVETNKPLLGICLGMQVMFEKGLEFGETKGLGIIQGVVSKIDVEQHQKLPHICWNKIIEPKDANWNETILKDLSKENAFYFVHSYCCNPSKEDEILTTTKYGTLEFCSAVKKNNVYGFQFHPEKSGIQGLNLLNNFKNL